MMIEAGTRVVLPSQNGSAITRSTTPGTRFAGCLRNATAVAAAAHECEGDIGVVAAGEQWPSGALRPAIEDLLGAGAIIAALAGRRSAEAAAAAAAFASMRDDLPSVLRGGLSGQELIAAGYVDDVDLAAKLDASDAAPRLVDGAFRA
jgi:2-phosphosulfolactate phosphatase